MVLLGTAATVIASQAVISRAFSITHQAVLPRLMIHHTSEHEVGQVYVPAINWLLWIAVAALVVGFRSSGHLAAAYGIAVTGTMTATTVLFLASCGSAGGCRGLECSPPRPRASHSTWRCSRAP